LAYIDNNFKVEEKKQAGNKVLHSSHVDLEPISSTPEIKRSIKELGFTYNFTENIESKKNSLKSILNMYQDCDYVVTTRLHGAIIAYAFKRAYIAISFDPKVSAFNKLYGGGVCITDVAGLSAAFKSDEFKVSPQHKKELDRVREFGKLIKSTITG